MKIFLQISLLFLLFLSVSSCIEIIDEINLNSNGTGNFQLTVNMSKSKSKIASIMLLDSIRGHKVPSKEQVIKLLDDISEYLENSEGISQVKNTHNFDDFIFTLNFKFQSVENINAAIRNLQFENGRRPDYLNLIYNYNQKSGVFSRNYVLPSTLQNEYNNMTSEDQDYFIEAIYTSIIRFDRNINESSNKKALISPNGKAIMLKTNAADLIKKRTNLSNTIQLN